MNKHVPQPPDDPNAAVAEAPERAEKPQQAKPLAQPAPSPGQPPENPEPDEPCGKPRDKEKKSVLRTPEFRTIAGIGGAFLAVIGAIVWWSWSPGEAKIAYMAQKARYDSIVVAVRANGILSPRDTIDVAAPEGGRVEFAAVRSGERVEKGQVLVQLASDSVREELAYAETERASRAADMARADADVAEDRAEVARERPSVPAGGASAAQARLSRALAGANEARALLRDTDGEIAALRARRDSLAVRAPVGGIVLKNNLDTDDLPRLRTVPRGETLFTMATDLSQLSLKAAFPESEIGRLHAGERAEFRVPAFANRIFAATLAAIEAWPKIGNKDGRRETLYAVMLSAPNEDGALRAGMNAEVSVVTAEARNVLVVPNAALVVHPPADVESRYPAPKVLPGAPRSYRVWVLADGAPEPRDIVPGLSDGRVTQVVSGDLRAGDSVIVDSSIRQSGKASS